MPKWTSAAFWPLLHDDSFCENFIAEILEFGHEGVYRQGRNRNALFGSKRFRGHVLTIRFVKKA